MQVLPVALALAAAVAGGPAFPVQAGRLPAGACPEPAISAGGIPRTREYLAAVVKCLDKSWKAYVERAGRTFREPIVRYFEEPADRVCGGDWPAQAAAFYCVERRTLVFPLTGSWIEGRTDLYPFKVAAHEYGHHVQRLMGVRLPEAREGAARRRYELQADCLAGAFLGSVWGSLGRARADWEALLEAARAGGDDFDGVRSHGKGVTRVRWLERGYRAVSPSACDTWSAPASRVA
ncbi:neutral zinc metallopeptidase [Actinomadura sp. ATCC 31491]|uniref:Neutral zinc metallopeptidase n=1 Tax=Actinomadura luzonensis TaxID=2805427 RepID=A0ABT0FYT7_9ACTN|nr:neutral zinc metallopeptidase [Actinomadura luzonensis]MCK2217511.1 neutral zinc metallopeptidase [Actinomadura luzonensis]